MPTESLPQGSTIWTLAVIAFGAVVMSAAPARAQDMRVDRLEIVEAGFYDHKAATVTSTSRVGGTVAGTVDELAEVKIMTQPPAQTARVGIGFGVRFRSFGERNGERAILRSVWKIPAPGIVNPTTQTAYRDSTAEFTTRIGTSHWRGYAFNEAWEVVPGTWTLEIWQGDRKLLEKSFEIK
jgi:Domain of unknown function (DUF3859)